LSDLVLSVNLGEINTQRSLEKLEASFNESSSVIASNFDEKLSISIKKTNRDLSSEVLKLNRNISANTVGIFKDTSTSLNKLSKETSINIGNNFKAIGEGAQGASQDLNGINKELSVTEGKVSDVNKVILGVGTFGLAGVFSAFNKQILAVNDSIVKTSSSLFSISKVNVKPQGLFDLTFSLAEAGLILKGVSSVLGEFENKVAQTISRISLLGSVILGGLSAALGIAIIKIAQFGRELGDNLTEKFIKFTDTFLKFDKTSNVFAATLNSIEKNVGKNIGSFESWEAQILKTSKSFNILESDLTKSAQEIALVGTKLGLNESQLKSLLEVSAEYAKINDKDVFQTTVNLVNALNGQGQAVQALGIKLGQTSVQQFAYSNGITKNINSLTESEKVQLRFSSLLKQYGQVAGVAAVAANSLADQQLRLTQNTERLNRKLGEGAAIIENNNLLAFALNKVIDGLNDGLVKTAGFFGALGARILSVGSFFLEYGFKIFAVTKGIKLLNIALASSTATALFSRNILLINNSLNGLASSLAGTEINIKSVNDILRFLSATLVNQLGINNKVSTSNGVLSTSFLVLQASISKIKSVFTSLLSLLTPFIPIILKISAIIAALALPFIALKKAFEELNSRTTILKDSYSLLVKTFEASSSIFEPVLSFFTRLKEAILDLAFKAIGFLAQKISKVIGFIATTLRDNPFIKLEDDTVKSLNSIIAKTDEFSNSIKRVGFDIRQIPEAVSRSIASISEINEVNLEELSRKLEKIRSDFENFGLSQIQIIKKIESDQLETLRSSLENRLILQQEYEERRKQVIENAANKIAEIEKEILRKQQQSLRQYASIIENGFVEVVAFASEKIGQSLGGVADAFKNFGGAVLSIVGDIAIQLGKALIAKGIAIDALKASLFALSGGAAIAAGAGLIALGGFLKTLGPGLARAATGGNDGISSASDILNKPNTGFDTTTISERNLREKETPNVQLTIQGNVFDSEETGTSIAKILSDAFNKQGVVLTDSRFA